METDPKARLHVHMYLMVIPGPLREEQGGESGKGIKGVFPSRSPQALDSFTGTIGLGQRESPAGSQSVPRERGEARGCLLHRYALTQQLQTTWVTVLKFKEHRSLVPAVQRESSTA